MYEPSSSRNSNSGGRHHHHQQQPKEPFSKVERRDWAETVLDNPELLMMYAQSSGDVSYPSVLPISPHLSHQHQYFSSSDSLPHYTYSYSYDNHRTLPNSPSDS